ALFVFVVAVNSFSQEKNLDILSKWLKYTDNQNALYHFMSAQAFEFLDKRQAEVAKVTTKAQWLVRQKQIRKTLNKIVGPFPQKTPLHAKITGKTKKEFYTIEKIIFESQPKFYVTSCLFLPNKLHGKTPAVIYCSGHTQDGFRSDVYQRVILNLVKKGFIVFAFDPVSQGERLQYFDPVSGKSKVGGPTSEHSYPGAQCFISGSSQARYMIWDGIRAVDYLLTRKEVDPQRIGITGRSGGGTQSAYIAAFDDRILAAAPECYITSMRRLWESFGPQDAEQNFFHGIASGIDHADLLEVRAPKPALMITTTRDFFSIQGARETAQEVKKVYQSFGKGTNFNMVEDDSVHASTRKNREAMYTFFQKHLNLPGNPADEDVAILPAEELTVTKTGQVSTSLGGETVFSLNKKETENELQSLDASRKSLDAHLEKVRGAAEKLAGFVRPLKNSDAVFTGRFQRPGYALEKYFIRGEGDYPIPFLLMVPNKGKKHPALLYLNPEGKSAAADSSGEMEWFVNHGYIVLAPDLPGFGEMGPGFFHGDAYHFKMGKASYNMWFASILIGRSITGMLAGDVDRLVNYFLTRNDVDATKISALARGDLCPALAHAAAFDERISRVALFAPLLSYKSLVINEYYQPHYILTSVAGALTAYDLPDLYALIAPRKLLLVNPADQNGKDVFREQLDRDVKIVKAAFGKQGQADRFDIRFLKTGEQRDNVFSRWIK
ncbi:MAG: prolyl oligopeptidase family serine peptidase, partial [Calditrichaeota bacterium]|nr:prolyl oligopeptidase family serine peptidase [Calditrichota bacterium]